MSIRVSLFIVASAALPACHQRAVEVGKGPVLVAAASDLTGAFAEIGAAFEARTGEKVTFTFGSTGLLAKQIKEGAPFDLLAAANVAFVDKVTLSGACDEKTKELYARGRIGIFIPRTSPVAPARTLGDLADARFKKIAIANPEHAPYGEAAKQALVKAGIWDAVKPRLVFGENIQQTLALVKSGNVEAAIIALSLAIQAGGHYTPIDPAMHAPLDQALVVCKGGSDASGARALAAFIRSPDGRAIMKRFGFALPGEAVR